MKRSCDWDANRFYKESFDNEIFLTDVVGILDGPLLVTNVVKAVLALRGKGTTNLRPSFHDAEVVSILLDRSGKSKVRVHAFEMTSEVDADGYFVSTKHAIITFDLEGFVSDETGSTHLNWFNHQNVLSSASVRQVVGGYELLLDGIYMASTVLYIVRS